MHIPSPYAPKCNVAYIPYIQDPSVFNPKTKMWSWNYGDAAEDTFIMEYGETVRY